MTPPITQSQRDEITQLFQQGLPLPLIALSFQFSEKALLDEMGAALIKARLSKMQALCTALEEMSLSQKSVTLSMAWFRHQLDDLNALAETLQEKQVLTEEIVLEELQAMSDDSLRDEIQKLLMCS